MKAKNPNNIMSNECLDLCRRLTDVVSIDQYLKLSDEYNMLKPKLKKNEAKALSSTKSFVGAVLGIRKYGEDE